MSNSRPSPEELLQRVEEEERQSRRGRLKIFLGYASRVGKSFRMLDSIEVIPGLKVRVDGIDDEVIDVVSILNRSPQVCLVDELAHDNPPGSRHTKRGQDVQELLDKGSTVETAVNL